LAETPIEPIPRPPDRSFAMARGRRAVLSWYVGLALILLLGATLRFHGLYWDQPAGAPAPTQLHPDERFLSMVADRARWPGSLGGYFDTAASQLNPYNQSETHSFVYGTFPLFLAKGVSTIAGGDSYDTTVVWGRRLAALFDTATIALVFALGASLFSRRAGLFGALLYALAVLPTQLAHFWTVDPFLVFFGTATLFAAVRFVTADHEWSAWLLGAAMGLGLGLGAACKVNALLFVPAILAAGGARIALRDWPRLGLRWRGRHAGARGNWLTDIAILSFTFAVALAAFRIAQPYAFEGPHFWDMGLNPAWIDDLQAELDRQDGASFYPPFVQFAARTPFVAPLTNIVLWGLGPALGVTALIGLAVGAVLLFKRREMAFLLPLVFAGAVFAFQGYRFVAFMRYFVPIYPVFCLMAGWAAASLLKGVRLQLLPEWRASVATGTVRRIWNAKTARRAAALALGVLIATTAFWALAFQGVYASENPKFAASRWIYDNVPPGSGITSEIWDDSLPYALPNQPPNGYRNIETEPYAPDSFEKVRELVFGRPQDNGKGGLVNADYVVIASNRIRDSVQRLEREYPATIRYYQLLDSGQLGFERVATFTLHPSFLGLTINDSRAEESFTVYDHPEVRIYKKTSSWNPQAAIALLNEAHPERANSLLPKEGRTNGLQFTPAEAQVQQSGGTFSAIFDEHGWASSVPWLWWLFFLEIAAFAAIPWVTWLFRPLPDRGYGLSKLLGLTSVVLPTWALVAWGPSRFSGTLAWTLLAAVVVAGATLAWVRRRSLVFEARTTWRTWLAIEVAFLGVFAVFLLLRAWNPDLWYDPQGGEKPMEIAYLTAIARSTKLPPYDPWFAGGSMNYYYMGWFFLAVPMRVLKMVPEVAFNLGIPTFASLGAATMASTAANLAGMGARIRRRAIGETRRWRRPAITAVAVGVILLLFMANLDGAHQMIERFQKINDWHPLDATATGTPLRPLVRVLGGLLGVFGGLWRFAIDGVALPPFDWWRSSRVHFGQFDITEFPFFSLLFADLHPHLMGVPFFGLVIALGITYVAMASSGQRLRTWVLAALIGVAVGLVRTVHTWDFPTAILIGFGLMAAGQALRRGRWQDRWWEAADHFSLAAVVMVVLFAPYTAHFETFDPGLVRAPETTQLHQYFVQYGVFIAIALAFLAVRYHEELVIRLRDHGKNPVLASVNGRLEVVALAVFAGGLAAFTATFGLATLALVALIEVYFVNLLWLEWRAAERNLPRILATAAFALAFAISAGVDLVTLKNDIQRMNTVFKFGLQAWQLFAVASTFAAWYVGQALWEVRDWQLRPARGRTFAAVAATACIGLLFLSSIIYLYSGTRARQDARFNNSGPTLNGLAFLPGAVYREELGTAEQPKIVNVQLADDLPLIEWLRQNVQGSPVIAEEVGPLYHWTGRISEFTGLPAVIGWDWHQIQQRTDYQVLIDQRRSDTVRLYSDQFASFALQYIQRYNVSYILVGTEERLRGTEAGLAKFDQMPELTAVFRSGDYAIYKVTSDK
jgi:YYY domain-containing protein